MFAKKILAVHIMPVSGGDLYFSTSAYVTLPSDTPANVQFLPRIGNDPSFSKKANLRIWGGSPRSVVTVGNIDLINQDGELDFMIGAGYMENAVIEMAVLFDTKSWDLRTVVVTGVVEMAEAIGEDYVRLVLRDAAKKFEVALAGQSYGPSLQNVASRAAIKPVTIGSPKQCTPVLVNNALLLNDTHDSPFFRTDQYQVFSRGVLATEGSDWRIARTTGCNGFEYLVSMAAGDPFTTNPGGQVVIDSTYIGSVIGDDAPSAFTVFSYTGSGPKVVRWSADATYGGANGFSSTPGSTIDMFVSGLSIPANSLVHISFQVNHVYTAGTLRVSLKNGTTYVHNEDIFIDDDGFIHFTIQVGGTACNTVSFVAGAVDAVSVTIDEIRAYAVLDTASPAVAAKHLAVDRGGLLSSQFDDASWATLEINGGSYVDTVGMYCSGKEMVADRIDDLATSYTAFWWVDYSGNLKVKVLSDPATTLDTIYDLSGSQVLAGGDIQIEPDRAPGLSTRWGYDRNIFRFDDSDFAGAVSAEDRSLAKAEYRTVVATAVTMHDFYSFAIGAPPVPTVLYGMDSTNGAVEPDRVCGFYTDLKYFTTVPFVVSDPAILTLDLGQLVQTDLSRFGMDASVKLLVGIEGTFLSPSVTLRMWS